MNMSQAENLMGAIIQSIPGRPPIAYPNNDHVGLPRFVIQPAYEAQNDVLTTDGLQRIVTEMTVNIELPLGTGIADQQRYVSMLKQAFPVPSRTAEGLEFVQPPSLRPPVSADGFYAVPVVIRGTHMHMSGD